MKILKSSKYDFLNLLGLLIKHKCYILPMYHLTGLAAVVHLRFLKFSAWHWRTVRIGTCEFTISSFGSSVENGTVSGMPSGIPRLLVLHRRRDFSC